ncbi:MAG TPA: hypothetical protein ENH67_05740 [Pseudoalteromonas sp.]|uniref:Sulfotransferase domain-containing protein n=1 Tax=marine sediment metagenome TaxID=412755 RepID=A0A0F9UIT3_9ZZZZ|nr:sulfotransferase [Pseudoalteromonas sp.]HDY92153.1 hypothetical protein [Pseudoalteromonas sp.]HDZ32372.1 hypothetical protein [Pseudoalteromonas sp.]
MHSYYIEECNPEIGHIRGSKVGILEHADLAFGGRLVVDENFDTLVVRNLQGELESEVEILSTLAHKLHEELGLAANKSVFRFDINLIKKAITTDYHFSVHISNNSKETLIFRGFIQPIELPDKVLLIVGSPRSGTSALGKACRKALKAQAHGESHAIEGIAKALHDTEAFFEQSITAGISGNLVNAIPKTVMLAEHLNMLRRIYRLYYGNNIYLDKTPGTPMLHSLPFALMAWPNAKVIFCKRRAMENIQSRLIKFPKVSFSQHVKQWKQSFIAWRRTRQIINQLLKRNDWFIEVDQFDMAISASLVCNRLSEFLQLTNSEERRLLNQLCSADRPEQTSVITAKAKSLSEFNWSEAQLVELKEHCDKEMRLQNYSYDNAYYLNSSQQEGINE